MEDRIQVPLDLEDFEVTGCEVADGSLEVRVRSTKPPACRHCGSVWVTGHGRSERRVRDRACSYPCVLRWEQRRFRCHDCHRTSRERHPEIAGKRRVTERFRRALFERACCEPFSDVAASESVSLYRVEEAFEAHAGAELVEASPEPPRVLSLDESAFKKRFRFHTVLSDPERGAVLDLVEGRDKGSVRSGLLALSDQVRAGIETVVIDCHWPYRQAVEEVLPNARIVVDKFHVLRAVDAAARRVRIRLGRRPPHLRVGPRGGTERHRHRANDPRIHGARWIFHKRADNLTASERRRLEELLAVSTPELRLAWLLREAFASIYEAPDRAEAERRLEIWIDHIHAAGLREFINTWRTLSHWREPILSYFDDRVTNAFAEGVTNKIKVLKRRAYGFRDPARYRRKVLLNCRRRRSREG